MPVFEPERRPGISRLGPGERHQRARIAILTRTRGDATEARRVFAGLKAERELREAAGRLVAVRQAQGLPDHVEDSAVLARIANLLAEPAGATP